MEKISLKKIAEVVGAKCDCDLEITSVCTDTRNIDKGCLFIAIAGENFDAHDFVEDAAKKGAAAVLCQREVECSVPVLYVKDTRTAYLDIAGYYRSLFSIPIIGITGSVGKTTTKEFVALGLSAKYKTLKTQGNFNNDIGMPRTLLGLDSTFEAAVIEMGMNHFGEIHNLSLRSRPTMGVITNIGVSHIENLGSREGILKAKLEILDGMEKDAPLILNGDNDLLREVKISGRQVYLFGIENEKADFRAVNIKSDGASTHFTVIYPGGENEITVPATGNHIVLNALCAFAVGVLNSVRADALAKKLGEYVPSGMRQRQVDCGEFVVIEDCYNASPDSMRAAFSTLTSLKADKKIAVLGDMLELGEYSERFHTEVGKIAAESGIDALLCYGEASRFYKKSAEENGIKKAMRFDNQDELLEQLLKEIEQGSAVLFKGSHGMHLENVIKKLYERKGIENE